MFEDLAKMGLGDMQADLNEKQVEIVNKLGSKTKVLLSSGLLPVDIILTLAQKITRYARENNETKLNEIESHLDLGLRVAINNFPFSGCNECDGLPECKGAMEGVEPISPEDASELMTAMALPTIGEA